MGTEDIDGCKGGGLTDSYQCGVTCAKIILAKRERERSSILLAHGMGGGTHWEKGSGGQGLSPTHAMPHSSPPPTQQRRHLGGDQLF